MILTTEEIENLFKNKLTHNYEIYQKDGAAGLFLKIKDTNIYEVHCCAIPEIRGKQAKILMLELLNKFIEEHPDCKKLYGCIPENNKSACFNAINLGFTYDKKYSIMSDDGEQIIKLYKKEIN